MDVVKVFLITLNHIYFTYEVKYHSISLKQQTTLHFMCVVVSKTIFLIIVSDPV